jgi:Rod binding domain-containing protein
MTDALAPTPPADPAAARNALVDAKPVATKPGDPNAGAAQKDPKIWEAAKKFEAMAIGQLLGPMFDTVDVAHSAFGGGEAEAAWRPMLVDAIGKQIEAHGGFGLAQPVYAAMLRAQEGGGKVGATKPGTTQRAPAQMGPVQPGPAQPAVADQSALRHAAYQPRKPR